MLEGFSLHADTAVQGNDRQGLGRLCRYGARGPVSERRLEKLEDGRYRYTPKKGAAFTVTAAPSAPKQPRRRIDWATLHRRTFGTDVLQCPCGGRRTVTALHSTRKAAEERLAQLGLPCRSLLLPPQTAPPQRELAV